MKKTLFGKIATWIFAPILIVAALAYADSTIVIPSGGDVDHVVVQGDTDVVITGGTSVSLAAGGINQLTALVTGFKFALKTLFGTETALEADATTATTAAPVVGIYGASATQSHLGLVQPVASTAGVKIDALKTRAAAGQTDADVIVASGDDILSITALGADGVVYAPAARILMESGGTPGADDMPGRIIMSTTADGAATLSTALTIGADQKVVAATGLVATAGGVVATAGDVTATAGGFVASASGQTLSLQEATAGTKCMGTATANGTTAVTVSTTCALTASRIFISATSDGSGTSTNDQVQCWTTNIVNATSFDLDCADAANSATFNWIIFNEAA